MYPADDQFRLRRLLCGITGTGNISQGKEPVLYIVVFEPYFNDRELAKGVKEYVTKIVDKPKDIVHSKTIDYIDNAIMANLAKVRLFLPSGQRRVSRH